MPVGVVSWLQFRLCDMWVVTTTDGKKYKFDTFEMASLAAMMRFGYDGYSIEDEDETKETEADEGV